MKIKACESVGFAKLVACLSASEYERLPGSIRDVDEAIRAELAVLLYLHEKLDPDPDAYLESLVRIGAIVRNHAADLDLAHARRLP